MVQIREMYNSGLENLVGKTKLEDGKVKAYNVKTKEISLYSVLLFSNLQFMYTGSTFTFFSSAVSIHN